VSGAVANGKGEVEYAYQKPGATGIFDKVAMYIKVKGSDGKDYILVSGKYKDKEKEITTVLSSGRPPATDFYRRQGANCLHSFCSSGVEP